MGGLGNSRRGGRAPPLMVAALIACILILGFNYWVSSSRNLELQTKLYELEGQVRRGEAERGVAEMKKNEFQEQINRIESLHRKELDDVHGTYTQEKAKLQLHISSNTKTIEELKVQLNQLNDDLGKLQKELQSCQANDSDLNKKFTTDLTQCQSQVLSQKQLCDEKLAAVKLGDQQNIPKTALSPGDLVQKNAGIGAPKEEATVEAVTGAVETAVVSQKPNIVQGNGNEPPNLLTNIMDAVKKSSEQPQPYERLNFKSQTVASTAAGTENKLQQKEEEGKAHKTEATTSKGLKKRLTGDKDIEVMDIHEEGVQIDEADTGIEEMLIGQGKADERDVGRRLEEPDEYDADEQVVGGVDLEKEQRNKNMEEEMANYNGDDENEGEFEADKQAALAQI